MVPQENSKFCFPLSPDVSLDFMLGNIRTQGKTKLTVYPHLYLCICILICTYVLVYMYMHSRYVIHDINILRLLVQMFINRLKEHLLVNLIMKECNQ